MYFNFIIIYSYGFVLTSFFFRSIPPGVDDGSALVIITLIRIYSFRYNFPYDYSDSFLLARLPIPKQAVDKEKQNLCVIRTRVLVLITNKLGIWLMRTNTVFPALLNNRYLVSSVGRDFQWLILYDCSIWHFFFYFWLIIISPPSSFLRSKI